MKRFADLSIVEGAILRKLLGSILVDQTRSVSFHADGETLCEATRNVDDIEAAYKDYVFRIANLGVHYGEDLQLAGWVTLVHGNDEDVISDYSLSLEDIIAPINDFINNNMTS